MLIGYDACDHKIWLPHACGNRHCPHCQAFESQRWIDQQLQKVVADEYFMITFTLPTQFRSLAWQHQREVYELMCNLAWQTVNTFAQNDKVLRGRTGAAKGILTHRDGYFSLGSRSTSLLRRGFGSPVRIFKKSNGLPDAIG